MNQSNYDNNHISQDYPLFKNVFKADMMKEYVRRFNSAPQEQFRPCLEYTKKQSENRRSSSWNSYNGTSDSGTNSNEYSQESLRKSHSQNQRSSTQTSLQSTQNTSLCQRRSNEYSNRRPVYQYKRRTPKQESNMLSYIGTTFGLILIISFMVDMKFEIDNETLLKEKQIQQCFNDYQQNKCDQPVQIMIDQCTRLAVCASKDPKSEVRMTTIFGKTLGTLFSTFFNHIGTMGLILMIALMLACFFRPKSYEEEHHVLKYT